MVTIKTFSEVIEESNQLDIQNKLSQLLFDYTHKIDLEISKIAPSPSIIVLNPCGDEDSIKKPKLEDFKKVIANANLAGNSDEEFTVKVYFNMSEMTDSERAGFKSTVVGREIDRIVKLSSENEDNIIIKLNKLSRMSINRSDMCFVVKIKSSIFGDGNSALSNVDTIVLHGIDEFMGTNLFPNVVSQPTAGSNDSLEQVRQETSQVTNAVQNDQRRTRVQEEPSEEELSEELMGEASSIYHDVSDIIFKVAPEWSSKYGIHMDTSGLEDFLDWLKSNVDFD